MMEKGYRKLASKWKLQHLVNAQRDCAYCRPFLKFIKHNRSTLKSLRIEVTHLSSKMHQINKWEPHFPRLPELGIENELEIRLSRKQDVNLLGTISRTRSCFNLIRISDPLAHVSEDRNDELVNCQFRRQFDLHMKGIIQKHQDSLKTVEIVCVYPLGRLCHPVIHHC